MARLPRLHAPGVVQRVVPRAAPGRRRFTDADDDRAFVARRAAAARLPGVALHAYVLLPAEVQLLLTPASADAVPRTMQALGRRYAPLLNRKTGRLGRIWDARYRSTLVDAERHLFDCMRQIEGAPVSQGLARSPAEWAWSSFRHHVGHETSPLVSDHALYWGLRNTPFERQAVYAQMSEATPDRALVERIVDATDRGWVLGDDAFARSIETQATRRLQPRRRGRPYGKLTLSPKTLASSDATVRLGTDPE